MRRKEWDFNVDGFLILDWYFDWKVWLTCVIWMLLILKRIVELSNVRVYSDDFLILDWNYDWKVWLTCVVRMWLILRRIVALSNVRICIK